MQVGRQVSANFERLVLGCTEANFFEYRLLGIFRVIHVLHTFAPLKNQTFCKTFSHCCAVFVVDFAKYAVLFAFFLKPFIFVQILMTFFLQFHELHVFQNFQTDFSTSCEMCDSNAKFVRKRGVGLTRPSYRKSTGPISTAQVKADRKWVDEKILASHFVKALQPSSPDGEKRGRLANFVLGAKRASARERKKESDLSPARERSERSPAREISERSPPGERRELSPVRKRSELSPATERSELSPARERSELSPGRKSSSPGGSCLYFLSPFRST